MWETLATSGPLAGWVAFIMLAFSVTMLVATGKWVPLRTHLREIGYVEREAKAKDATIAEQKEQIKILLGSRDKVGPVS